MVRDLGCFRGVFHDNSFSAAVANGMGQGIQRTRLDFGLPDLVS